MILVVIIQCNLPVCDKNVEKTFTFYFEHKESILSKESIANISEFAMNHLKMRFEAKNLRMTCISELSIEEDEWNMFQDGEFRYAFTSYDLE